MLTDESLFYYLDDVHCSGNENLLSECEHRGVGVHNCGVGYEEAGVLCSSKLQFHNNVKQSAASIKLLPRRRWMQRN